jgi:hypothetical protein
MRQRPNALVGEPRVRPPAGTTAALGQVVPVAQRAAQEVSSQAGGEEVSSGPGQGGRDNRVQRRAPPDRVASVPTGVAARVCKHARVAKVAARRL